MQLFYVTPAFKYVLLSFLVLVVAVIYFVRSYLQQEKAKRIYEVLKKYTEEYGHI
jgi:membrane protein implicated in regulation of membrane protease activity